MTDNTKTFYLLLTNSLFANVTNSFVWFALTFWVYLETASVLATSYIAGVFAVASMVSSLVFGDMVDRTKKKVAMLYSNLLSLTLYCAGALLYFTTPADTFQDAASPYLWGLIVLLILGSVAGNLRMIALSTSVSLLWTDNKDKANGMIGTVNGVSFAITSIISGITIGWFGMDIALIGAVILTLMTLLHLSTIKVPEILTTTKSDGAEPERFQFRVTWQTVIAIPGLLTLIFFTTFNNFLGGVFMALMDAYGLSLMSVEAWGLMLSVMSFGFIAGSAFIAKFGLGPNPLKRMLLVNVITWTTCIFFVIQPSIILLALGMLIWMSLVPFVEAAEHTVIQTVVPYETQGRVFGFAQSVESAATPITTFLIGPIAQFFFIPFMTTGAGVYLIGDWFGTGANRGIALVFIASGIIGLIVTLLAFRTNAYKILSGYFKNAPALESVS